MTSLRPRKAVPVDEHRHLARFHVEAPIIHRNLSLDQLNVSNPDADHIGGFLDVFDAFPVQTVYVSGDPNNTLTYNTFLRGVRDEGARTEVLRAGALMDWGGVRADT